MPSAFEVNMRTASSDNELVNFHRSEQPQHPTVNMGMTDASALIVSRLPHSLRRSYFAAVAHPDEGTTARLGSIYASSRTNIRYVYACLYADHAVGRSFFPVNIGLARRPPFGGV